MSTKPEDIPEYCKNLKNFIEKDSKPEKKLPKMFSESNREFRENAARCYNEMYPDNGIQKTINENIKSKELIPLIKAMYEERSTTDAKRICGAVGLFSNDDDLVYEMLFNWPKWLRDEVKKKYKIITKRSLKKDLMDSYIEPIKGNIERFLHADRDDSPTVKRENAENFCKLLTENEPETWMTKPEIMDNFAELSPEEIILTARLYKKEKGEGLMDSINGLQKSQKNFLSNLLGYIICPPLKFAERINNILNTKNVLDYDIKKTILDLVMSRCDVDLPLINKFYMQKYGKDLRDEFKQCIPDYSKSPAYNVLNSIITDSVYKEVYKKK